MFCVFFAWYGEVKCYKMCGIVVNMCVCLESIYEKMCVGY